jgi:hypothetical protein
MEYDPFTIVCGWHTMVMSPFLSIIFGRKRRGIFCRKKYYNTSASFIVIWTCIGRKKKNWLNYKKKRNRLGMITRCLFRLRQLVQFNVCTSATVDPGTYSLAQWYTTRKSIRSTECMIFSIILQFILVASVEATESTVSRFSRERRKYSAIYNTRKWNVNLIAHY